MYLIGVMRLYDTVRMMSSRGDKRNYNTEFYGLEDIDKSDENFNTGRFHPKKNRVRNGTQDSGLQEECVFF